METVSMNPRPAQTKNPLANYMRQPKIYIRLPSQGKYWPDNSIIIPETGEFPVYSMTAKDELSFKTPDALMNGQAMVDVIQSCMPNIKNAWNIPTLDLDTVLIAIRLATYGSVLPFKHKIPIINEEVEYEIDLTNLLDQQLNNIWEEELIINPELVIYVKPLSYKHMTQMSLKSFEASRIINAVNDETLTDEKKLEVFNSSFSKLTQVTINLIGESIYKIITPEVEVTDQRTILEFVNNIDKEIFDKINKHLNKLKTHNEIKPLECITTEEQQALGAPAKYQVPVNFNDSDFFDQGF
jgi:hypothetical protein